MPPLHPVLEAKGVVVRFPDAARDAVRDVSLRVEPGSILAVLGPSGSGKSTLALALAGAVPDLVPASLTGTIRRLGETGPGGYATTILQDTDSHLVALSVEDEIAFALENRGLAPDLIDRRIDEALGRPLARGLGREDRTLLLSGGWRQRLAIAAALAEKPALLVADEPLAHLDTDAATATEEALAMLSRDGGGCVLAEHRADTVARLADAVLVLGPDGAPVAAGATATALFDIAGRPGHAGIRLPAAVTAGVALQRAGLLDHGWRGTGRESLLRALGPDVGDPRVAATAVTALGLDRVTAARAAPGPPLLRIEAASLRRGGRIILDGIDLEVASGEVLGLAGGNGAGKTSLALLASRRTPTPARSGVAGGRTLSRLHPAEPLARSRGRDPGSGGGAARPRLARRRHGPCDAGHRAGSGAQPAGLQPWRAAAHRPCPDIGRSGGAPGDPRRTGIGPGRDRASMRWLTISPS